MSEWIKAHMQEILLNEKHDWFTARLLRLMDVADEANLKILGNAYPDVMRAYLEWRNKGNQTATPSIMDGYRRNENLTK